MKRIIIAHAYYFFSEAIIIYLMILPIVYYHYSHVSYWVYIGNVMVLCGLFSLLAKFTEGYHLYLFSAPIIVGLFIIVGYPVGLSVFFTVLLTWRYITIRSEKFRNRENTYLLITLILGTSSILFSKDVQVLVLVYLQLINLVIGYNFNHISNTKKMEHRTLNIRLWPLLIGFFSIITATILSVSDTLRYVSVKAWEAFQFALSFPITLLSKLIPTLERFEAGENQSESNPDILMEEGEVSPSIWNFIVSYVASYVGIGIILIIFGFIMFMKFYGLREALQEEQVNQPVLVVREKNTSHVKKSHKTSLMKRIFYRTPVHPVRKLVYKFEKQANRHRKGRRKFETVEDWLRRIGIATSLNAYQKVRYGNLDINEKELVSLQLELKELIKSFDKRN